MTGQSPIAYSYIRMSTELQLQGDSLRRQQEKSQAYADKHGLEIDKTLSLRDIGVSAFKGKNVKEGDLGRFLGAVQDGRVAKGSYLLVESLDRISRDQVNESAGLLLQIINAGISVVTVADERVYGKATDFADLLYALVVLSRAHEESLTKSMRLSASWENKRKSATVRKLTGVAPGWLKLAADRTSFELDSSKVETVRLIFDLADQGLGTNAITRKFSGEKRPTIGRSGEWHDSYVTKILQSRSVLGEYQPHRVQAGKRIPVGTLIPDYFPRIIEDDLFYRVQAARRKRRIGSGGRKGEHLSSLFTHVATCGYCGNPMRFINKGAGPKGGSYLKCSGAVRGQSCSRIAWRYDDFEKSFLLLVKEVDLKGVLSEAANRSVRQQISSDIAVVTEQILDLEERQKRVLALYSAGNSALELVSAELNNLEAQIARKRDEKAALEQQHKEASAQADIDIDEMKTLIDEIRDRSRPNLYEKRSSIAKRLKSIIVRLELQTEGNYYTLSKQIKSSFGEASVEASDFLNAQKRLGSANKMFVVEMVDGISRTAIVSDDDPSEFEQIVHNDTEFLRGESEQGAWVTPIMDINDEG